ncbi:F-box/LRR-repeat protein [Vigna angularis]|uniref:F-box/LRR-repeat protein n=1 Tax=Phaseolus angularis TaxID=3914 RepID=A0A8T0L5B8_PHAAN|nr:F-box/LRR-repeat protein [Vigna angularis]
MRGHDWINNSLPDELIVEIFSHLHTKSIRDACSLVCRRWFRLERRTRATLRIGATHLFLDLLPTRFSSLRNLYIDERLSIPIQHGRKRPADKDSYFESTCLTDTGLSSLGEGFPKLHILGLIWCSNVSSDGLTSFARKCSSLKALDLQGCYVGDQGLAAVGQFCKHLENLNLRFCEGLTDSGLVDLAVGVGKSLKSLGVAACAKITDISMEAVGSNCCSLETLSLDSEFIHNKGLLAVAQGCSALKVLKLQCINITDDALKAVGTSCLSLELLALYSFQRFTDKGLHAIGNGCKKLKNLTLIDCYFLSDKGLEAIATGCKELTHLEVNGCHNIGTLGIEYIGRSCHILATGVTVKFLPCACLLLPLKLPTFLKNFWISVGDFSIDWDSLPTGVFLLDMNLTELALLYCHRIGDVSLLEVGQGCKFLHALHLVDCSSIGDDAMCSIASGCRNLKKLHIRRCYKIGNKGIIAVGKHCTSLTDLSIRFCDRVGDGALTAIAEGCSLRSLNVSGCHQIGDAGVISIARGCPQLSHLDVSVLQNLGDMAMAALGENCTLLKEIVLSHCRQITDVGLTHLVKSCTMLESCQMVYCSGITSAGVATVVSSCPNIKKVLVEKWKVSQRTKRRAGSIIAYLCVDL